MGWRWGRVARAGLAAAFTGLLIVGAWSTGSSAHGPGHVHRGSVHNGSALELGDSHRVAHLSVRHLH